MKKLLLFFFCFIFLPFAFAATDVAVENGLGFKTLATPSLTISPSTASLIGTVPTGTKNVYVTSFNGSTIVGDSTIASGTIWSGACLIASGSTVKLDGIITLKPVIYLLSNETGSTIVKIRAWSDQP